MPHLRGCKQTCTQQWLSQQTELPDYRPRPSMQPGMTTTASSRLKGTLMQLQTYLDTSHRTSLIQRSLPLTAPSDHNGPMCRKKTAICMARRSDLMP